LEILTKTFNKQLARVRNITGATVLGSGKVVPILNIADIMKSALKATNIISKPKKSDIKEEEEQRPILVVEDSITSRMLLKNILESAGYRVTTAIDGIDGFTQLKEGTFRAVVSDVEIKRQGPSYTIDTVKYFLKNSTGEKRLYLIVGMDAFLEIDTWKRYRDLFDLIPIIVMPRPENNQSVNMSEKLFDSFKSFIHARVSKAYRFDSEHDCFIHATKQSVYLCRVTPINISSTKIRELIKKGAPVKQLLPDAVEGYIKHKGLYV